jgi:MoxR-like ATPase
MPPSTGSSTNANQYSAKALAQTVAGDFAKLNFDARYTASLAAGTYIYDLELTSPTGSVTRLLEGTFIVDEEVTTI